MRCVVKIYSIVDDYCFCIRMTYRLRDHKLSSFKLLKNETPKIKFTKIKPENIALIREKQLSVEEYVKHQLSLIKKSVKIVTTNK